MRGFWVVILAGIGGVAGFAMRPSFLGMQMTLNQALQYANRAGPDGELAKGTLFYVLMGLVAGAVVGLLITRQQNSENPHGQSEEYETEEDEGVKSNEKTCPRCAENVKAAAVVCRFCRYEFEGQKEESAARQ